MNTLPTVPNIAPLVQLSPPKRPADFTAPRHKNCRADLWLPEAGGSGMVVLEEADSDSFGSHSELCLDVRAISQILLRRSLLSPFFHCLGAVVEHTAKGDKNITRLSLPGMELLSARSQALSLPAEDQLPSFMSFDGAQFKAEDQRDAVLDHGSFLVGMEQDFFVHDWMHLLGGLLLLTPAHVNRIQQRFREAQDRSELTDILAAVDDCTQYHKLVSRAASALIFEAKQPGSQQDWSATTRQEVAYEWASAGELLHKLLFGQIGDRNSWETIGQDFRRHCRALGRAALTNLGA